MASSFESQTRASLLCAVRDPKDEQAWASFAQRYERVIRACCRTQGLRPDEIDELTQSVLAKLVLVMPKFVYDPEAQGFRHWLRRVVVNTVRDYWRREKRRSFDRGSGNTSMREALANLPAPAGFDVDAMVLSLEEQLDRDRRVQEACERIRQRIEDRTWQAFWLTTVEELRGKDVASRLGMEVAAVHMAKSRVLKMIRQEIEIGGPG
jgi:RNA polymerase sigma-70 factor (ECF subfamily)